MLADIEQHITQSKVHRARRRQRARMVPVRKHPPFAPELAIGRASHPNRQPLHPSRQRPPITRLHEQMQMIPLHRKLHQPKAETLAPLR
jgi:hypothetical protein